MAIAVHVQASMIGFYAATLLASMIGVRGMEPYGTLWNNLDLDFFVVEMFVLFQSFFEVLHIKEKV